MRLASQLAFGFGVGVSEGYRVSLPQVQVGVWVCEWIMASRRGATGRAEFARSWGNENGVAGELESLSPPFDWGDKRGCRVY